MFKLADISGFESLGGCVKHYEEVSVFNAPIAEASETSEVSGSTGSGGGRRATFKAASGSSGLDTLFDSASSFGAVFYDPASKKVYFAPKAIGKGAFYVKNISPNVWKSAKDQVVSGALTLGQILSKLQGTRNSNSSYTRGASNTGRTGASNGASNTQRGSNPYNFNPRLSRNSGPYGYTPSGTTRNSRFIDLGSIED